MCYTGGPRCSSDATVRIVKANVALNTEGLETTQLNEAKENYRVALNEWLMTPVGISYLESRPDVESQELAKKYQQLREDAIALSKSKYGKKAELVEHTDEILGHMYGEIDDSYTLTDEMLEAYKKDIPYSHLLGRTAIEEAVAQEKFDLFVAKDIIKSLSLKEDGPVYAACDGLKDEDREAIINDIEKAYEAGDLEAIDKILKDRIADERFNYAVDLRNDARDAHHAAEEAYKYLRSAYRGEKLQAEREEEISDWEEVRQAALVSLDEYERVQILESHLNDYKAVTARAAARAEALRENDPNDPANVYYTEDKLFELQAIDTYESGSREWLESRQKGVGGSDIGKIMFVDPDPTIARQNFEEIMESKVLPISDDQVERQEGEDFSSYSGRGNAWEGAILREFQSKFPDENVVQCKTSWKSKEWEHMYANFDGLLANEKGEIDGILEIKTGSNKDKWGDESEGFGGLPKQYQMQTLWYARAAGVKRVKLAAMIDDRELRVYEYDITPELEERQERMLASAQEFWGAVERNRELGAIPPALERSVGIPRAAVKAASWRNKDRRTLLNNLSAYRDQPKEEVIREYYNILGTTNERDIDEAQKENAMKRLYTDFNPADRKRPIVGLDLEVSGLSPTRGRIIEAGISVAAKSPVNGGEYVQIDGMDRLYGLPRKAREGKGTGAEEVHNINLDMIKDKVDFSDPENQKQMLEMLKRGPVEAHNAVFEDNWLRVHLPGYAEARDKGEIRLLCTMMMSRHLFGEDDNMPNHKLKSLVERGGEKYENAHRAKADVDMMIRAFHNAEKSFSSLDVNTPRLSSDDHYNKVVRKREKWVEARKAEVAAERKKATKEAVSA